MACDHYHRYREDIGIMKQIGISAYRFSISWARILPQGQGTVNEEGIAFYNRLIDELITNGIEPYITLFHWDYPYALYQSCLLYTSLKRCLPILHLKKRSVTPFTYGCLILFPRLAWPSC